MYCPNMLNKIYCIVSEGEKKKYDKLAKRLSIQGICVYSIPYKECIRKVLNTDDRWELSKAN